ncbi:MAG: hypothetical protein HUU29_10750 [Planctomycetaceae bacterium]|nr:hypothetical protein [Planctomycetaceae bacterium]
MQSLVEAIRESRFGSVAALDHAFDRFRGVDPDNFRGTAEDHALLAAYQILLERRALHPEDIDKNEFERLIAFIKHHQTQEDFKHEDVSTGGRDTPK